MARNCISVVALTHAGAVRPVNEDTVAIGPWLCCRDLRYPATLAFELTAADVLPCLVADGLGGHTAGQIASWIAAETLIRDLWGPGPELAGPAALLEQAARSVHEANRALYARMSEQPHLAEMGSTVAGVAVRGEDLAVFNVGDSRVYRWQKGRLCQLTTDDVPESEVRTGLILQSLGGSPEFVAVEPHVVHEKWAAGCRYLICSDGLYEGLTFDAIQAALGEPARQAVASMFEGALAAGATDNISIVLLELA